MAMAALPREALEHIVESLAPADIVHARAQAVPTAGGGRAQDLRIRRCSLPLAGVCRSLRQALLGGDEAAGGAAPVLHRALRRALGDRRAGAVLRALPADADPRCALQLAARWTRFVIPAPTGPMPIDEATYHATHRALLSICAQECAQQGLTTMQQKLEGHEYTSLPELEADIALIAGSARTRASSEPGLGYLSAEADELEAFSKKVFEDLVKSWRAGKCALFPRGKPTALALQPVVASTSDHSFEVIAQTLVPPSPHPVLRGDYWSSIAQVQDSRDYLIYGLPGLCSIAGLRIKAYEELSVVFAWPSIRIHVFAGLPGSDASSPPPLFRTPVLRALDTSDYQRIDFDEVVFGRYLLVEMVGKCRKQQEDPQHGFFICVDHIEVYGRPLQPARPRSAPPKLPAACSSATIRSSNPAASGSERRVQVLGYSQERQLYATVATGGAERHMHPEMAPKPDYLPPEKLRFSAEGEEARSVHEDWLGAGGRVASASKAEGGELFRKQDWPGAVAAYTTALEALRPPDEVGLGRVGSWGWVHPGPDVDREQLATVLLSNRAECHLRAAQRAQERSTELVKDLTHSMLWEETASALACATADACAALAIDPRHEKSARRLKKACEMVGEAQAQRLGDTAAPRTAERIARDSMRGCADKAQIEALIDGPWASAAVAEFGATVEID